MRLAHVLTALLGLALLLPLAFVAGLRSRAGEAVEPPPPRPSRAGAEGRSLERAEAGGFLGVIIPPEAVDISSPIDGRLEHVSVEVGDTVQQGEVLAVMDTRALRQERAIAEAELRSLRADLRMAELTLADARQRLRRREDPASLRLGAISEEELSTARHEERMAAARLESAQAKLQEQQARLDRLRQDISEAVLRAPFNGTVADRLMDPGALTRSGQSLLHLLRAGAPEVRFAVPEEQVAPPAPGRAVLVTVRERGLVLRGRVVHLAPEVDAASRILLAIAELEDAGGRVPLPAGTVVRVHLETGEADDERAEHAAGRQ